MHDHSTHTQHERITHKHTHAQHYAPPLPQNTVDYLIARYHSDLLACLAGLRGFRLGTCIAAWSGADHRACSQAAVLTTLSFLRSAQNGEKKGPKIKKRTHPHQGKTKKWNCGEGEVHQGCNMKKIVWTWFKKDLTEMKTCKFRGSNWGTWFLYAGACNLGNKEAIDMHITVLFQVSVPKLSCSSIAPPKFTCLHFRKVLFKSCSHYISFMWQVGGQKTKLN